MLDSVFAALLKGGESLPCFAILILTLFLGYTVRAKRIAAWGKKNVDPKFTIHTSLTTDDNVAVAVYLGLYMLGMTIALSGVLFGNGSPSVDGFIDAVVYSFVVFILFQASAWFIDKRILPTFVILEELIKDRNLGTAFAAGGAFVATGFMLNGALTGESVSALRGVTDLGVYWIIGQGLIWVGAITAQRITPYDLHALIKDDNNVAAGIAFGGFLAALGIVNRSALLGAGSALYIEVPISVTLSLGSLVVLALTRLIVDKVILSDSPLADEIKRDKNAGAGALVAVSYITVALLLAAAISAGALVVADSVAPAVEAVAAAG